MNPEARLLWLDLKTTGLDPKVDEILAVGMQVTDAELKPLATVDWLVKTPLHMLSERLKGVPREMHKKSGLLARLERGEGEALSEKPGQWWCPDCERYRKRFAEITWPGAS